MPRRKRAVRRAELPDAKFKSKNVARFIGKLMLDGKRSVGGSTYQVPVEIRRERGNALAMRWLIRSARSRTGKSMAEKLASELMDAAAGQGATIKKREETHKMAESNKAFAHYRW